MMMIVYRIPPRDTHLPTPGARGHSRTAPSGTALPARADASAGTAPTSGVPYTSLEL